MSLTGAGAEAASKECRAYLPKTATARSGVLLEGADQQTAPKGRSAPVTD
jgi:hypothetical protein